MSRDDRSWKVVAKEKAHKSAMWTSGVVLESQDTKEYKWYCLASQKCKDDNVCINLGKSKSSTNPVKHLRTCHEITSKRSNEMSANKQKRAKECNSIEESRLYQDNFTLASEFLTAMMIVRCLLPQCFVESPGFRLFAGFNCKSSVNLKMTASLIYDRIIELYASCRQSMKKRILRVKQNSKIPMFHLIVDEWTAKLMKKRFIGIRIRFVDENFELVTMLLSIRHFNPDSLPDNLMSASEILLHWGKGILHEFGLSPDDFYSATTDAGPEVKCMVSKLMRLAWEWCVSHLITNGIKEASGWVKRPNSHQQEVRKILKAINAVIAKVEMSKPALAAFRRICLLRIKKELSLKKYLEIRFCGVVNTLERLLEVWECLEELFETHYGQKLPLPERKMVVHFCGLLKNLKCVTQHAQAKSDPVSCTTLLMLIELDLNHLHENAQINANDSVLQNHEIHPMVKKIRKNLRDSLDNRFFNRYAKHGTSVGSGAPAKSNLLEMASVMHPAYAKLSFLDKTIERINGGLPFEEVNQFKMDYKNGIHQQIIDMAVCAAGGDCSDPNRTLEMDEADEIDYLADEMSNVLVIEGEEAKIRRSFSRYLKETNIPRLRKNQKDILSWWRNNRHEYPYLSQVARCLLGSSASSGTIELDFGVAGMYVNKSQLSTRPFLLEMKIFIKRNEEFLDWNTVECLTSDVRDEFVPSAPSMPFVDNENSEDDEDDQEDQFLL